MRSRGDAVEVVLCGDIDLAAVRRLDAALTEVVACDAPSVVVDLTQVSFMDSSGLHFLITLKRRVDEQGRRLVIRGVSGAVGRLLEVSGLSGEFETPVAARGRRT